MKPLPAAYVNTSLVPRLLPDFIVQPWRKSGSGLGMRLRKHCVCMLNTEFTQDQEKEMNFVWPNIVPSRRRCSLVRGPDKEEHVQKEIRNFLAS